MIYFHPEVILILNAGWNSLLAVFIGVFVIICNHGRFIAIVFILKSE